ncbi:DNA mismatch repair endonuclease MutL [Paenibacillus sp. PsM32]|uniref:DNA mismatch repair endonuclease MutL n=1 Tax=Paenibacillus sp. PsM32 TaxID=3030536 RepID=UPI00263A7D4F|nr:DNA mismatch repair endonuclease MutL [Paenibacillus sp. PsM32]MDN4617802.1 DNA mismatch repair endonuclease MutL [Paenibacillus sp. PsM32]
MGQIRVLDEHIANQIAAGEVVERPASVVKELVENAIDAKSSRIDVHIGEGGLEYIRVQDNGQGIAADDCETAFYRHATSKLTDDRDLYQITSLGFRGEALPSIAAVSKVELLSSATDDGAGRRLVIEGGTLKVNEDEAAPRGTDFRVNSLFYNTPARLKYMKTVQTELGHISDVMYRMSLAHPEIAFTFRHNGNLLLQTPGTGDMLQVIAAVYGTSAAKMVLPLEGENLDYQIGGYIGRPEIAKSSRNAMSIVVNGRYIRNYAVNQAILRAYHTLLPINRYPLAVLQLTMHPSLVDVNVHPSKMEVRFSKEAELMLFVEEAIRQTLRKEILIPHATKQTIKRGNSESIIQEQFNFTKAPVEYLEPQKNNHNPSHSSSELGDLDAPYIPPFTDADLPPESKIQSPSVSNEEDITYKKKEQPIAPHVQEDRKELPPVQATSSNKASSSVLDQPSYAPPAYTAPIQTQPAEQIQEHSHTAQYQKQNATASKSTASSSARQAPQRPNYNNNNNRNFSAELLYGTAEEPEIPQFPDMTLIGQHHGTYLVAQNNEGLFLIDQHAAHERINYEFYYEKFGRPEEVSQELLLPITLEFTLAEANKLKDRLHWFERVGVYLEHFGGQTFRVTAYPYWLPKGEEQQVIEEMAEWVLSERAIDLAKLREQASTLCSCKASIKANQKLTEAEAQSLLDRLATCRQPYTCPHGRPIVVSFSSYDLEKMFKRVM